MRKRLGVAAFTVPVLAFLLAFPLALTPQSRDERSLITQRINEKWRGQRLRFLQRHARR